MMMAKTRGEEVSKPNIALTDPTGEKKTPFYFSKLLLSTPTTLSKRRRSRKRKSVWKLVFRPPHNLFQTTAGGVSKKKFLSQEKDISCCDKLGLLKKPFPLLCLFCTRRRRRKTTGFFFFCKWSSSFGSLVVRLLFSCREMSF